MYWCYSVEQRLQWLGFQIPKVKRHKAQHTVTQSGKVDHKITEERIHKIQQIQKYVECNKNTEIETKWRQWHYSCHDKQKLYRDFHAAAKWAQSHGKEWSQRDVSSCETTARQHCKYTHTHTHTYKRCIVGISSLWGKSVCPSWCCGENTHTHTHP